MPDTLDQIHAELEWNKTRFSYPSSIRNQEERHSALLTKAHEYADLIVTVLSSSPGRAAALHELWLASWLVIGEIASHKKEEGK